MKFEYTNAEVSYRIIPRIKTYVFGAIKVKEYDLIRIKKEANIITENVMYSFETYADADIFKEELETITIH